MRTEKTKNNYAGTEKEDKERRAWDRTEEVKLCWDERKTQRGRMRTEKTKKNYTGTEKEDKERRAWD